MGSGSELALPVLCGWLQGAIGEGLDGLFVLWDELGIDESAKDDRNQTVFDHFMRLLNKYVYEY